MNWHKIMLVACIGSLSISSAVSAPHNKTSVEQPLAQSSVKQLQQLAKSITVKVLSKDFLGTGILIHKEGSVYTVLTNAHVLKAGKPPYQIQTPDTLVYGSRASKYPETLRITSLKDSDLAVLQFYSPNTIYAIASFSSTSNLRIGNEVFAAGFPIDIERNQDIGFVFRTGKISLVLNKALEGGYRIGYTNNVQKGMSGGPLLNRVGKVVAINGMHAEPLWGEPYVYQDGTEPEPTLRKQISQYSWGIPIETFMHKVSP